MTTTQDTSMLGAPSIDVVVPGPARVGRRHVLVALGLLALAVAPRMSGPVGDFARRVSFDFLGLVLESLPFLLVGAVLAAVAERRMLARLLPAARRHPVLAVALAPLIGTALPLCDCGIVPVARRLRGAGNAALNAFVAGAPLTNPIVIVSTVLAFPGQPGMVLGRFACGLAVAFAVAALARAPQATKAVDAHSHEGAGVRGHVATELSKSLPTLVIGCLVAAALKAAIPMSALQAFVDEPLLAAVAFMALAFVMSLCSQADAFVAAALPIGTLPRLAFLVLGPQLDIKTALLYGRSFGRRWVVSYAAVVVPGVLMTTVLWTSWISS
jgi:uncharacterized membrane protein YraQ (UPF0718 family)